MLLSASFVVFLSVAGCGQRATAGNNVSQSVPHPTGTANVAYAGSLQITNDMGLAPAFTKATGFQYEGYGNGATAVANLIRAGEITPNVFESIGTAPLQSIGQNRVDYAIGFAGSPLVIAYSPKSRYAKQLSAITDGKKPLSALFPLMEQPGFRLGRTDPNADPQGQYFIMMMHLAQADLHLPAGTANRILGSLDNAKQVYSETDILSRLQAGQMDACSAYLPEAIEQHLPYIQLPDTINMGNPADAALYAKAHLTLSNHQTVTGAPVEIYITTVQGTPDQAAGEAFVRFALSKEGLQMFKRNGYTLTHFQIWGRPSAIPRPIRAEMQSGKNA